MLITKRLKPVDLTGVVFDGTNFKEVFVDVLKYDKIPPFTFIDGVLKPSSFEDGVFSIKAGDFVTRDHIISKDDLHLYEDVTTEKSKVESEFVWVVKNEIYGYITLVFKGEMSTSEDIDYAKTYSLTHATKLAKQHGGEVVKCKKGVDGKLEIAA